MVTGRKRDLKWLQWVVGVILVAAAVAVVMAVKANYFDKKGDADGNVTVNVNTGGAETKESTTEQKETKKDGATDVVEKKDVEQYDGETPNTASRLTGVLTHAAVNSGKLMIRVNIDQYLENGTCKLVLKQAGNIIYSSDAEVMGSAATATCAGFDVSTAELPSGGTQIMIYLISGDRTGEIDGEIEL